MHLPTREQITRAAEFLRIIDAQGNLSLTNIALMAALIRTLMLPQLSIHDLLTFLGTVAAYQFKKFAQPPGVPDSSTELQTAVADLQGKVTALQLGQAFRKQ